MRREQKKNVEGRKIGIDFLSYENYNERCGGIRTDMAKIGRPKSENVKKKVLSIRVEDSMYKCICDYARKHKMTVTEVVLQGLEKY